MFTAVTTILGLIPLTFGINFDFRDFTLEVGGESSQWWGPMGAAVIFGLAIATILTLIIVPIAYTLLDDLRAFLMRSATAAARPMAWPAGDSAAGASARLESSGN